jgi:hypothetical protein
VLEKTLSQLVRVRIKASGQIVELIPSVAQAMLVGQTAVRVDENGEEVSGAKTAALNPVREKSISPAQNKKGARR